MPKATERLERPASRAAAAFASLIFAVGATVAYAAQRVYEAFRGGHVDPSLILVSAHAAYPWRALVATWVGGLCALIALIVLRGELPEARAARLARHSAIAAALGALILALVAVRFP